MFVLLATIAACCIYVGNFHPERLPRRFSLPPWLIHKPSEHRSVGGTPLGLVFGTISLGIFVFAALLGVRKKLPFLPVGNVQRWLRGHIWLTLLTIPLILLHSGFSSRWADDDVADGALRHRDGERNLWTDPATQVADDDEGKVAGGNCFRTDP